LASIGAASENRFTPLVKAVNRVERSVVNIHTRRVQSKLKGMGTGVIVDERGYIVTNEHVIHGVDRNRIEVELIDGAKFMAKIIRFDSRQDLAIIKINVGRTLPVAPFGTSSDLMRGESVFAVGNAFGYTDTVTRGIISALGRDVEVDDTIGYKNLIQTDASINPGNSGGPLVNIDGEVIGINVAIRANAQRIGFAIPIDDARLTIARMLSKETYGTFNGLVTKDLKSTGEAKLVVQQAQSGSPAAQAGLQPGDELLKAGPLALKDRADLERGLLGIPPGEEVSLLIKRSEEELTIKMKIAGNGRQFQPPTPIIARGNNGETSHQKIWRLLGMRFENLTKAQLPEHLRAYYEGGLRVIEIRGGGPAATKGLGVGDVVVGLARYQMNSIENVEYVLEHRKPNDPSPLKFHIIRGKTVEETFVRLAGSN